MTLQEFNALDDVSQAEHLQRCCGSSVWVKGMMEKSPFGSREEVFRLAAEIWRNLSPAEWKEAFRHHPKIGDLDSLRTRFAATAAWASNEQAGVQHSSDEVLLSLAKGNAEYEQRFGYIFIVCATGKSADEMLTLLLHRLNNAPETELQIAASEQAKITRLRLEKLLSS